MSKTFTQNYLFTATQAIAQQLFKLVVNYPFSAKPFSFPPFGGDFLDFQVGILEVINKEKFEKSFSGEFE